MSLELGGFFPPDHQQATNEAADGLQSSVARCGRAETAHAGGRAQRRPHRLNSGDERVMCRRIAYRGDWIAREPYVKETQHWGVSQSNRAKQTRAGATGDGPGRGWY